MPTEMIATIGASLLVSILGMVLTNAIASGWKSSKITSDLREIMSTHVSGLHTKIDETSDNLRMRIDGGLRVIDDKMDDHFKDDVVNFSAVRRETGDVGHALREKIRDGELWNRDHFLLVKHFDEKIGNLVTRLEHQDRVSDSRHESSVASQNDVVRRLEVIEKNGH